MKDHPLDPYRFCSPGEDYGLVEPRLALGVHSKEGGIALLDLLSDLDVELYSGPPLSSGAPAAFAIPPVTALLSIAVT